MRAAWANLRSVAWRSRIGRDTTATFGRQVLEAGAQLGIVILIARKLGPDGNGLHAMAILLPSLLANLLNLGVGPATVYYLARQSVSGKQAAVESAYLALVVGMVGTAASVVLILVWGPQLFPGVTASLLWLGLAAFPAALLRAYWSAVLQGLERFRAFNWTAAMPSCVGVIATGVALYGMGLGVAGAVGAYLAGQIVGVLAAWWLVYSSTTDDPRVRGPAQFPAYKRALLAYGWKAHLSNVMAFVNYRADLFLVNLFLSPAATGVYVIALHVSERLWILSRAVSTVLLPRLAALHAEPDNRFKLTQKAVAWVTVFTALASGLALSLLYWLVEPVLGAVYRDAVMPLLFLLPGVVLGAGSRIQSNAIAAAGRPEWNFYASLVVVGLNIAGNCALIPRYGVSGAAIATSIAYAVNAVIKRILINRI